MATTDKAAKPARAVSYEEDTAECVKFLQDYVSMYSENDEKKYMQTLQSVANREQKLVVISLDDLEDHDENLLAKVVSNTRRYQNIFADAIEVALPVPTALHEEDALDILTSQRKQTPGMEDDTESGSNLPPQLRRRYEVCFAPSAKSKPMAIRDVKASNIGQMVTVRGIVTRVSDVKPLMSVAAYTCEASGYELYQEVNAFEYMPLLENPNLDQENLAVNNKPKGKLIPQTRGSKFVKFQEVKIQEMSDQVPIGHIPRTMTVHLRGEHTRSVSPGDCINITGVFLPTPFTGLKAMRAGLVADTFLESCHIEQTKKAVGASELEQSVEEELRASAQESDMYSRLASSIAPEIFGHEDVKKGILLLLVGGTNKQLPDGMKLRGDLHMCLMGDPGVAKSQLLKYVTNLVSRAVYTTGRGSSGVGLTAAVQRDPVTNDFVLEGGALVLADRGICCIDEFDKMEESDRTAIHEVMEQQTVSIAKAGITTTLNARTSVLAAANPAWGRYDTRRSPQENIALPAALLSRFDLMWLILDKVDVENDRRLAEHVLHVHKHSQHPKLQFKPMEASKVRDYIALAKTFDPYIPSHLAEYVASAYATLRQEEMESDAPATYTTARTLLSILRMAQALARLRFSNEVAQADVEEALRLMAMSKFSLSDGGNRKTDSVDVVSKLYAAIRDFAQRRDVDEVPYGELRRIAARFSIDDEAFSECMAEYEALNVWQVDTNTNNIIFVS